MGIVSAIEWTGGSWNPWTGCNKISPACQNCYMFRDMARYGRDGSIVTRSKPPTFQLPLKKRRSGEYALPSGSKVFTCSWSDWFHEQADEWRQEAWEIIKQRPDLIFQIVTKRTERIAKPPACRSFLSSGASGRKTGMGLAKKATAGGCSLTRVSGLNTNKTPACKFAQKRLWITPA